MRAIEPSTRRGQRGQAIVLIVFMLVVLVGFLGLGLDGGRAYVDRREVQDATDAAALAAADNYINTNSYSSAYSAAAYIFGADERTSGTVIWTSTSSSSSTATWSGSPGTQMTISYLNNTFNGTAFYVTTSHPFPVAFMQTLGVPAQVTIGSAARTVVLSQSQTPALLTLSQSGCPGSSSGASLTLQGNSTTAIIGALYANGTTFSQSGSALTTVAGNAFAHCGVVNGVTLICYDPLTNPPTGVNPVGGVCPTGTVLGVAYPGTGGGSNPPPLSDPNYTVPLPALSTMPQPATPSGHGNVELVPGLYNSDPNFGGGGATGCYFLDPGVYAWSGGFTANGGFFSNELRPPDEHAAGSSSANLTTRNAPNLWDGTSTNVQNCSGSFEVFPVGATNDPISLKVHGHNLSQATWSVFVTSVRTTDSYGGQTYSRESAPSMCRPVTLDGTDEGIQVAVSNIPGAQGYNVYAAIDGGTCSGTFGYLGFIDNGVRSGFQVTNNSTGGCPSLPPIPTGTPPNPLTPGPTPNAACSLGNVVSQTFDAGNIVPVSPPIPATSSPICPVQLAPTTWCQYPTGDPLTPGPNDGGEQPAPTPVAGNPPAPLTSPLRDIASNGGGDRADENQCRTQGSGATAASPCSGATVTPGAVIFYFPTSPNCFDVEGHSTGSGDLYIFGGIQYRGITMFAPSTPAPGNTCTAKLAGGSATTIIGTIYMPLATLMVVGNSSTAVSGQVIVGSATIDGTSGTAISYNPGLSPPAPGARLIY